MTGTRRSSLVVAAAKQKKGFRGSLDFAKAGSQDANGYRRGSFGIGEKESVVIWGVVALALVLGGSLSEEQAQKIGEAQRSLYPKPPGLEKAEALRAKSASPAAPSAFPASAR